MDSDVSLMWHGPFWYAGRIPPGAGLAIPGASPDIDLVDCFQSGGLLHNTLPAAVVIDLAASRTADLEDAFWNWLNSRIASLETDVPVVFLCSATQVIPSDLRPTAIFDSRIPDETLFAALCDLQRALLRSEEARIRRMSFGRVPGYGVAPHYRGTSGLLVVGIGGNFPLLERASQNKIALVGAFDQNMAEQFLSQRAFDAVVLDATLDETLENIRQLRLDARYASMPVMAIATSRHDVDMLFKAGASDVFIPTEGEQNIKQRLATSLRFGKRRRLADKVLAESHKWLTQQLASGGVSSADYDRYIQQADTALKRRGLKIWEMKLLPENFSTPNLSTLLSPDLYGTVLSIADATSREEDLICFVHDMGPVAVLKSERGKDRLQARINAILGHTQL